MKKHRYKVSFSLTTLIYAAFFLGYILFLAKPFVVSQKEKDKTINLSLSQFVPEVIEQPMEPEEPVVEEPVVEEEPEPEIKEPEPLPEPVVEEKPVVEPTPVIKKVQKKPLTKKPKPKKKHVKKKKAHKKKRRASHASSRRATSSRVDPNKKSAFLAKVRAKINRGKSYPRIARRRGMQGTVKVRFTILKNGHVGSIAVKGPKVFHSSAKGAVKKAFPISVTNAPLHLPATVNLSLRYQLR